MKNRLMRSAVRSRGSALLVVLALLLLLTTLSVAFLSRATFERQLSNASFGQGKVDLAGLGAITAIIGDLQQEIVAGSTGGTSAPTLASGFYYPNAAATAVPAIVGFNSSGTGAVGLENLLKISYRSTSFWPNAANYNNTAGPIRAAAVSTGTASLNGRSVTNARWNSALLLAPTSSSNYAPIASNFVTPDWIYIARDGSNPTSTTWSSSWESLPSVAPTTATSTTAGTNPITQRYAYAIYDEGGALDLNVAGSPIVTSTGTYATAGNYSPNQPYKNALAYADLLQLPSAGPGTSTLSTYLSTAAKQEAFVNAIVGWRNSASLGATSNVFPNTYTVTGTPFGNAFSFDQNVIFNPGGFLSVASYNPLANSNLSTSKSGLAAGANFQGQSSYQSDNAFASRQQLLQFFLVNLAQNSSFCTALTGSSATTLTTLVNVLPYLGTFSRDISQPSYASPVSFASSTAPTIQTNTFGTGTGGGGNNAYGGDAAINPAFLAVTVGSNSGTSGWTRNNGATAIAGEPLVKKRFALMRLAWLTYAGPSYNRNGVMTGTTAASTAGGADYDIYQMENTYGIPASFLVQGTPQNIYNYFGLSWVPDPNNSGSYEWAYSHSGAYATSSSSSSILTSSSSLTSAKILTLKSVAGLPSTLAREPDFFELLKAGLCAGSIGKAYTASNTLYSSTPAGSPADYYGQRDQDVDNQIIQIGANIISQYQPSGYPARILFDDGLFSQAYLEHRGVVDLPYIYGVQESKIRTTDSTPAACAYNNCPVASTATGNGACVDLQVPVIWNPHAWTSTSDNSDGNPRPTNFRIYAVTSDPNNNATTSISVETEWRSAIGSGGSPSVLKGYFVSGDVQTVPAAQALSLTNTEMDFSIPQSTTAANDYNNLFREPTLLNKPTIPAGSGLAISGTHAIQSVFGTAYVLSLDASTDYTSVSATDNKEYIGVLLGGTGGKMPLAWKESLTAGAYNSYLTTVPASTTTYTIPAEFTNVVTGNYITYRLQYKEVSSGKWITYDEKFAPIVCASSAGYNNWKSQYAGYGWPFSNVNSALISSELGAYCFDPRTGRWSVNYIGRNGLRGQVCQEWAVGAGPSANPGWAAPVSGATTANVTYAAEQNAIWAARPDEYQGFTLGSYNGFANAFSHDTGPVAAGWYPAPYNTISGLYSSNDPGYTIAVIRPGLTCQNNMGVYSASSTSATMPRYTGDANGTQAPTALLPAGSGGTTGENLGAAFYLGCYADPDGVVRRGMAAYVPPAATAGQAASASAAGAGGASGIPFKPAYTFPTANSAALSAGPELSSRPIMLNRPFRSVADIGHVFSDTPWRNLDFSTPESGNPGFLDIFCINDTNDPNGLVAGKVDLNTRQASVLQAVLAGAYKDVFGTVPVLPGSGGTATADVIAKGLVSRTTGGTYLVNVGDLVGKWSSKVTDSSGSSTSPNNIDGSQSYIGFSGTSATTTAPTSSPQNLSSLLTADTSATGYSTNDVNRLREVAVRALANCGTTRVWNLMIDVIAQTGRFPSSASSLASFNVEGERRYWVHVAIDRSTGKVLDEQIEEVKE